MPDLTVPAALIAAQLREAISDLDLAIAMAYMRGFEGTHSDLADLQLELERVRSHLITQPNARSHRRAPTSL